jgi:hypothetical protein
MQSANFVMLNIVVHRVNIQIQGIKTLVTDILDTLT